MLVIAIVATRFFPADSGHFLSLKKSLELAWYPLIIILGINISLAWSFFRTSSNYLKNQKIIMMTLLSIGSFLVISFVQSSLTISLGMLGALSIIRFRTPVKEPLDLVFIFFAVLTGIGFGAKQDDLVIIGFTFVFILNELYRFLTSRTNMKNSLEGGYLTLIKSGSVEGTQEIIDYLKDRTGLSLIRIEEGDNKTSLSFKIKETEMLSLEEIKRWSITKGLGDLKINYTSSESFESF